MKILFLSKRQYMNKDLVTDRYGRFYEIPRHLSGSGHKLNLVCLSYRARDEITLDVNENFQLASFNLGINPFPGLFNHYSRLDDMVRKNRPDIIIAASDCFHIILGSSLAKRNALPFVADLYDNFEFYKASRIPGVLPLFSRALRQANAITVVSGELKRLASLKYTAADRLHIVENAINEYFHAGLDRQICRQQFGFDKDQIYIGTAGDLSRAKGIDALIQAFIEIAKDTDKVNLVLAGARDKKLVLPARNDIRYLGNLQHQQIAALFSALDTGVICIKDDNFGRYCFPQKFYEMTACGLPVIASHVGEMSRLLVKYPSLLFKPDDLEDMKRAIRYQLQHKQLLSTEVPTWQMQADKFDRIIQALRNI